MCSCTPFDCTPNIIYLLYIFVCYCFYYDLFSQYSDVENNDILFKRTPISNIVIEAFSYWSHIVSK